MLGEWEMVVQAQFVQAQLHGGKWEMEVQALFERAELHAGRMGAGGTCTN
jgi:hypothetical protein